MYIATGGQSSQYYSSGRQDSIAAISVISAAARCFADTGVTSYAATKPTITKAASKRVGEYSRPIITRDGKHVKQHPGRRNRVFNAMDDIRLLALNRSVSCP